MTDDFIKIGADVALSAYEFIYTSILKESMPGLNNLLE